MNPISARLLNQQLICPQFTSPHDVVAWMGAMQGQEYSMMRWAVAMRTKRPSAKAFARDFDSGRIIRTHLFRTTWQLVAAEDYASPAFTPKTNILLFGHLLKHSNLVKILHNNGTKAYIKGKRGGYH